MVNCTITGLRLATIVKTVESALIPDFQTPAKMNKQAQCVIHETNNAYFRVNTHSSCYRLMLTILLGVLSSVFPADSRLPE